MDDELARAVMGATIALRVRQAQSRLAAILRDYGTRLSAEEREELEEAYHRLVALYARYGEPARAYFVEQADRRAALAGCRVESEFWRRTMGCEE